MWRTRLIRFNSFSDQIGLYSHRESIMTLK